MLPGCSLDGWRSGVIIYPSENKWGGGGEKKFEKISSWERRGGKEEEYEKEEKDNEEEEEIREGREKCVGKRVKVDWRGREGGQEEERIKWELCKEERNSRWRKRMRRRLKKEKNKEKEEERCKRKSRMRQSETQSVWRDSMTGWTEQTRHSLASKSKAPLCTKSVHRALCTFTLLQTG